MPAATDKFSELETRILRTIELLKSTRQGKEKAEKELAAALGQIGRLEHELNELKGERDLVKNKVESLLESLSELTEDSVV